MVQGSGNNALMADLVSCAVAEMLKNKGQMVLPGLKLNTEFDSGWRRELILWSCWNQGSVQKLWSYQKENEQIFHHIELGVIAKNAAGQRRTGGHGSWMLSWNSEKEQCCDCACGLSEVGLQNVHPVGVYSPQYRGDLVEHSKLGQTEEGDSEMRFYPKRLCASSHGRDQGKGARPRISLIVSINSLERKWWNLVLEHGISEGGHLARCFQGLEEGQMLLLVSSG